MESATQRIDSRFDLYNSSLSSIDRGTQQRVDNLINLNAQIAQEKSLYRTEWEREQAGLMTRPGESRLAYSVFGGMIGVLPLASLSLKIILNGGQLRDGEIVWAVLFLAAGCLTGLVGFATGRFAATAVRSVERMRQPNRLAMTSLIGLLWGAVSGTVGGLILFILGAFVAAVVGGLVGAIAVPIFATLHQSLRYGDLIEAKHFLPIALGITLSLCALILGA